ncbi:MAG: TIGR03960 family B12-binding radical SAM protein, partial [Candidatus Gastranaerophilales bacterium]|nr:TIGR03960 family B12-binding radical SAM protein [Candidatus Gastranaerophilales bacterium]
MVETITNTTLQRLEKLFYKINKPSRYIGGEIGSANKDWNSAEARAAFAFPDLYEIGISNLGLRILYDRINNCKNRNFLADRVYAPETDFRDCLKEEGLLLYGLESKKPLSEFDVIAFSLQYELSYPTLLSMLELGGIPYKNEERNDSHPIVIAGGPGSYNPEPVADFIDAFIIGDGETVIIEIMETVQSAKKSRLTRLETLKKLADLRGVYVPVVYDGTKMVEKRIEDIDNTDYPVDFPVPFSSAVHDRAVIEIRRGCGRMCRFCQPCFVNFPVRERSPQNIIRLTDEVLKNTGYEEYSLLSLSSNDYKGIETLVKTLNDAHSRKGISLSLPSQRADRFSLELAELIQSVRKSTVTIAPEAGTQRLRNVINKNLTERQIIEAAMSTYKAGWQNIKLYFMIGLPTETFEDLDGIYELLKTIMTEARQVKSELGLKKNLSITCTVSIFVPKPFTPFQWTGQDNHDVLYEKIKYLKEKTKNIKGVKLNFHDIFLCRLEAVFSRGDRQLGKLIEAAYQNGSYLDAWREHFNRQVWLDSAEEAGINLEEYAEKT